jgi:hypothetical protein
MSNFLKKVFKPLTGVSLALALIAALALGACSTPTEPSGVDKTTLTAAIAAAEDAKANVVTASAASAVPEGTEWVTAEAFTTFSNAITAAGLVAADPGATQAEVDAAVTALNAAKDAFDEAKEDGTGGSGLTQVNKEALTAAIATAKGAKAGVATSADGSGLSNGIKWVTAVEMNTFNNAINTAELVKADFGATQPGVDAAVTALNAAKDAFDEAKKTATGSNNTKPDLLPDNWKTLDYAGWQTWFNNLDQNNMTEEEEEDIISFIRDHLDEFTQSGKQFWEELIGDDESPEEHRGTWKKGNITLVISSTQITVSGANWNEANGTFQIGKVQPSGEYYRYYYFNESTGEDNGFGLNCKVNGANLIIGDASGPDELHGTWTKAGGGSNNTKPDNWKTLDYAGWQTWFNNLDQNNMTEEEEEDIISFIGDHLNEFTQGGKQFWEELIAGDDESPEEHRGTWKKGNITLMIGSTQITVSGSNRDDVNGTFQIGKVQPPIGKYYFYYYFNESTGEDNGFGLNCKLNGANLIIGDNGGPPELHGTWTKN